MGTSILHIKTEIECKIYLFDEEKGISMPDSYFNIEVRKGEQDLLFVSTNNNSKRHQLIYNVEQSDCDYRIIIRADMFEKTCWLFSIGEGVKVEIAPGNLAEDGKSFVKQQWMIGGMFFWGSNVPIEKTEKIYDYANHKETEAINDCKKFRDWGENIGESWRTPTIDEWYYLFNKRNDAQCLHSIGCINGIYGIIILPDKWELPEDCSFYGMPTYKYIDDKRYRVDDLSGREGLANEYWDIDLWCNNSYSIEMWIKMESAGAVFLPMYKHEKGFYEASYWSSTPLKDEFIWRQSLFFSFDALNGLYSNAAGRNCGMSVRLIRQYNTQ